MSKKPKNEESSKTDQPRDVVAGIIEGKRIAEMTENELIEAMKQIEDELDRRNPKGTRIPSLASEPWTQWKSG